MIIIMIFSLIKKIPVQGVAIPKAKRFIRPFFISRKDQPPYGFIIITHRSASHLFQILRHSPMRVFL